jgi:hypothetical protein
MIHLSDKKAVLSLNESLSIMHWLVVLTSIFKGSDSGC